jgi:SAM-dependent methyltransferase
MPYPLRSASGLSMIRKYCKNWHSILMVHAGLKGRTIVKFRDGVEIPLSKSDYGQFREYIYQKYLQDKGFRYSRDMKNRKLISLPDGFKAILPDSDYSWHFDEIYETGVYGRPDLKDRIVIDVGAAIGDTALYFCGLGAERVYAFDPDKAMAELARENVSLNGLEGRIIVLEQAATADLIDDIIKSTTPEDRRFFLKVDCEGCEYELLRELLSKNLLSRIDEIILEYHFGPNFEQVAGREKDLINYLEKAGFDKPVVNDIYIIHAKRNVVSSIITP